ncbi:MAG TPA: 2OG-Fe(II) oxygenase [Polyangiaceae bacterium]|nr:2OG-Fe(II) oxygenase [Polyangiaceae bacterium]
MNWKDGSVTAKGAAASVKRCLVANTFGEMAFQTQEGAELLAHVVSALMRSEEFQERALPFRISEMRFMRYPGGGSYGLHTDEPINPNGFRADLSFTLLLQPASVGGDLVVDGETIRMVAGDVYLYPSTTAHGVTIVDAGERIAIVGWVQSYVRDHAKRALIADLNRMANNEHEREPVRIQAVRNELLRRWGG